MAEKLLTAKELGDVLGITVDTVENWAHAGRIPRLKMSPKVVRYELAEVMAALRKANLDLRTKEQP